MLVLAAAYLNLVQKANNSKLGNTKSKLLPYYHKHIAKLHNMQLDVFTAETTLKEFAVVKHDLTRHTLTANLT